MCLFGVCRLCLTRCQCQDRARAASGRKVEGGRNRDPVLCRTLLFVGVVAPLLLFECALEGGEVAAWLSNPAGIDSVVEVFDSQQCRDWKYLTQSYE